ncbi:hypothetical protein [Ferruginibacter sp.]
MQKLKTVAAVIFIASAFLTACDKTVNAPPPPATATKNTPNFICQHQPTSASINGQFVVYDLNNDANKDKKYFIVSLIKSGADFTDSCTVIQSPKPIDSLAPNWPATIKSASFGTTNNIITDAKNRATVIGGTWDYGTITLANIYAHLNDALKAGAMAGKKPLGRNTMIEEFKLLPAYPNYQQFYRQIAYYFKDGKYTDGTNNAGAQSLDTLFTGANVIDWVNIDGVVQVETDATFFLKKHFYFDWTNWMYHVVYETRANYPGTSYPKVTFNYKGKYSLDKFCKWPDGWQKK